MKLNPKLAFLFILTFIILHVLSFLQWSFALTNISSNILYNPSINNIVNYHEIKKNVFTLNLSFIIILEK